MTAVPAFDTSRPFRRSEAIASGVPPQAFRRNRSGNRPGDRSGNRSGGNGFTRLFRGVYLDARVPITPAIRVQAAVLASGPSAFASHASAARWYGVPIPTMPEEHVTVTCAGDRRVREGIRCSLGSSWRVMELRGLRVSSPGRMFVELGAVLSLVDLVVVGDHLVRKRLVRLDQLIEIARTSDLPGACAARRRRRTSVLALTLRWRAGSGC